MSAESEPSVRDVEQRAVEFIRTELGNASPSSRRRIIEKFVLAALGSIPWIGGFISAAVGLKFDEGQLRIDSLQGQWLEEHARKIETLMADLRAIAERFEKLGSQIDERVQSEEYLQIVRKAFRVYDHADTSQKRRYISNLVTNSAGTRLTSDDVVRLFVDWLSLYHEAHFMVIRQIFSNPGSTRFEIWDSMYGEPPREDSAEADLFKLLIRDLTTGGVIRQDRETTESGEFLRKRRGRKRSSLPRTLESAFEDTKPYVLTGLGRQFVHYTMNEVVERLEGQAAG